MHEGARGCRTSARSRLRRAHPLAPQVRFEDVARAIAETAFVMTDLPIFLSLEMHCSPSQQVRTPCHARPRVMPTSVLAAQAKIAKLLRDYLGDALLIDGEFAHAGGVGAGDASSLSGVATSQVRFVEPSASVSSAAGAPAHLSPDLLRNRCLIKTKLHHDKKQSPARGHRPKGPRGPAKLISSRRVTRADSDVDEDDDEERPRNSCAGIAAQMHLR